MFSLHKQNVPKEHETLPSELREAVLVLKVNSEHLGDDVENALARARYNALQALQKSAKKPVVYSQVLSWTMFNQSRMVGVGLLSICAFLGLGLFHTTQPNTVVDTLILSAELPPEAFVDNAFEPWQEINGGV